MDNREREDIDDKKLWENGSKAFREKVMALKEKIIKKYHANLQETNGDNVIYLAAILYTMNPQQARRTKHCILNESIYLGLDLPPRKLPQYPTLIMSKDISITGTGVDSTYQASVKPYAVRYLTENMLDQIPATHYMDDTSYIELSVTIVQLVNIVVECIDEDGDKWVKVVMIIYTIMSVLQTLSLMILHKQSMVLSILYERDTNSETPATLNASDNMRSNSNTRLPDRSPTATNGSDLQHKDAFLERIINKADIKTKDSFKNFRNNPNKNVQK
ncbi:hypothetical protein CLU79DRAFT_842665 [Phycomyces nitens]|nr:hypothetical protein CLU79DRAFT_842665 [Phycomyces nitens]